MPYNHKEAGRLNKEKRHVFTNYIRELVKQYLVENEYLVTTANTAAQPAHFVIS